MDGGSFLKLPEDKRNAILQVAAEEFIRCGFSGASTNIITRRAGISKGILFHYFGSKDGLYLYLLSEITQRLVRHTETQANDFAGDSLYDNMIVLFAAKAEYFRAYPQDMVFLDRAGREMPDTIRPEALRILQGLADVVRRRRVEAAEYTIGKSRLREGVSREQAMECVMLALEALDARFYALYRGKSAEIMADPRPMLETTKLFLDVVCRGLFPD